ncbi:hypothetical protein GCM10012275_10810 [Longimycelium tulufanense]|uniref:Uncharacterized protein n=1 Tax=Longimycelium tulufanense TaxID=907463 RepID=A0A8J3C9Y7_9PSEU|nr:hypothetical protein [Longimycelium tulufanense]GGM41640.1 hypothetical protein GCM10012275_10810 [Longimycelium tulufanense]
MRSFVAPNLGVPLARTAPGIEQEPSCEHHPDAARIPSRLNITGSTHGDAPSSW